MASIKGLVGAQHIETVVIQIMVKIEVKVGVEVKVKVEIKVEVEVEVEVRQHTQIGARGLGFGGRGGPNRNRGCRAALPAVTVKRVAKGQPAAAITGVGGAGASADPRSVDAHAHSMAVMASCWRKKVGCCELL